MADIKLVRLFTGEDIITRVTSTPSSVTLSMPVLIIPTGDGKIQFAPYCHFTEEDIVVKQEHVVFVVEPQKQLVDSYREATTGIQVPQSSGIIT